MLTAEEIDKTLKLIEQQTSKVVSAIKKLRADIAQQGQQDGIEGVKAAEKKPT